MGGVVSLLRHVGSLIGSRSIKEENSEERVERLQKDSFWRYWRNENGIGAKPIMVGHEEGDIFVVFAREFELERLKPPSRTDFDKLRELMNHRLLETKLLKTRKYGKKADTSKFAINRVLSFGRISKA